MNETPRTNETRSRIRHFTLAGQQFSAFMLIAELLERIAIALEADDE